MNWKPGDIAIIGNAPHTSDPDLLRMVGEECVLCEYYTTVQGTRSLMQNTWRVEVMGDSFLAAEKILRKPYDGNEVVEWSSCVFQPKELVLLDKV